VFEKKVQNVKHEISKRSKLLKSLRKNGTEMNEISGLSEILNKYSGIINEMKTNVTKKEDELNEYEEDYQKKSKKYEQQRQNYYSKLEEPGIEKCQECEKLCFYYDMTLTECDCVGRRWTYCVDCHPNVKKCSECGFENNNKRKFQLYM